MKPAVRRTFNGTLPLFTGVVLWSVFGGVAYGQDGQPVAKSQAPNRLTMTECEGVDNCTTWMFLSSNGWKGYGKWRTGEEAVLEIESVKDGKIVIHRTDVTGTRAGLTATYTGTLRAGRLGGEFESHYQGYDDSGNWYAMIGHAVDGLPPSVMHFCAVNCFTLNLDEGGKRFVAKNDDGVIFSIWTIESFTRESVILHRRDAGGFTVVYAGQISKAGGDLINQTANGNPDAAGIKWGPKLHDIPGSNAERAAARGLQTPLPQSPARGFMDTVRDFNTLAEAVKNLEYFFGQR